MYIDISSVDQLMKSTIEEKLYLKNQTSTKRKASFYILENAAKKMLEQVAMRKQRSAQILEKAAINMLQQIERRKQTSISLNL